MNNVPTPNTSPRAIKKQLTPEPEFKAKDIAEDKEKKKRETKKKRDARRLKLNGS